MLPHSEICDLGTYCTFNKARAEMIFMDILRVFLTKNDEINRVKVAGLHVRRRPIPTRLSLELVVSDEQKVIMLKLSKIFFDLCFLY